MEPNKILGVQTGQAVFEAKNGEVTLKEKLSQERWPSFDLEGDISLV